MSTRSLQRGRKRPRTKAQLFTGYMKSNVKSAIDAFADDLRANGHDVIPVREGNSTAEEPAGDTGWWYMCCRGDEEGTVPSKVAVIEKSEGLPVVGEWAGDDAVLIR